jgi:peptidyl-prolyl cis-trans isomerase C
LILDHIRDPAATLEEEGRAIFAVDCCSVSLSKEKVKGESRKAICVDRTGLKPCPISSPNIAAMLFPSTCSSILPTNRRFFLFILATLLLLIDVEGRVDEDAELKRARLAAKPWYTKYMVVGGMTMPFTPTSLVVFLLSAFYVTYYLSSTVSFAEASHILISDASPETKKKLEDWKAKIGSDYALFSKYAADHSTCSSKTNGGSLGRFKRHTMAPPFDNMCFDPDSPLGTTLGPIQTQFGWHLIYIHNRRVPKVK